MTVKVTVGSNGDPNEIAHAIVFPRSDVPAADGAAAVEAFRTIGAAAARRTRIRTRAELAAAAVAMFTAGFLVAKLGGAS